MIQGVHKRTGIIRGYRSTRRSASFVFSESDGTAFGVIAVAAGLAGLGGQAVAAASHSTHIEEDADFVEFDLDGQVIRGWLWRSPFKEGDAVEVVCETADDHLNLIAMTRPNDRIIALYPHCSRGRVKHFTTAAKWWFIGSLGFTALLLLGAWLTTSTVNEAVVSAFAWAVGGSACFFALIAISLARKWMPFVRAAEKVFDALGWSNPSQVDLVKSSKAKRNPDDPGEFGTFYFRY